MMQRRQFLGISGALGTATSGLFASCEMRQGQAIALPPGELLGPDLKLGHRLRTGDFPKVSASRKVGVLIVGGGIAGLSAAWQLTKQGITDWELVELEEQLGGNARAGRNAVSAHPWGAHYLPLPTREATQLRSMLADLDVLHGDPQAVLPQYDETMLVHAPQERLYINGLWQESLWPRQGVAQRELDQYKRFEELALKLRNSVGADDKRAFASPSALASRDPQFTRLDQLSFAAWLTEQGFDSPNLHWIADYATRDDFGTRAAQCSAWAGIHYFACRDGQALHAEPHSVLTWPEGNGFLIRKLEEWLLAKRSGTITRRSLCSKLLRQAGHCDVELYDATSDTTTAVRADRVIWAAPAFVLVSVWANAPPEFAPAQASIDTAPWLVANLTLSEPPYDLGPAGLAWDNVLFESNALGYVIANHQQIRVRQQGPVVLTYYLPLAHLAPKAARQALFTTPHAQWAEQILRELAIPHPTIRQLTQRIDLWRWPHAMPRPTPGFLSSPARRMLEELSGALVFGHSDVSGLSLFEEAHATGVRAARTGLAG